MNLILLDEIVLYKSNVIMLYHKTAYKCNIGLSIKKNSIKITLSIPKMMYYWQTPKNVEAANEACLTSNQDKGSKCISSAQIGSSLRHFGTVWLTIRSSILDTN